jgi:hypothetical protein
MLSSGNEETLAGHWQRSLHSLQYDDDEDDDDDVIVMMMIVMMKMMMMTVMMNGNKR